MSENWKILTLCSALFAALTAIFGKLGVSQIDSNFATLIRTLVIVPFILILLFLSDFKFSSVRELNSRSLIFLLISGLCTGVSWLCYYRALKIAPASSVAPLDKLSVALSVVFAWLFLGEAMTWSLAFGATLIISGTLVILRAGSS